MAEFQDGTEQLGKPTVDCQRTLQKHGIPGLKYFNKPICYPNQHLPKIP